MQLASCKQLGLVLLHAYVRDDARSDARAFIWLISCRFAANLTWSLWLTAELTLLYAADEVITNNHAWTHTLQLWVLIWLNVYMLSLKVWPCLAEKHPSSISLRSELSHRAPFLLCVWSHVDTYIHMLVWTWHWTWPSLMPYVLCLYMPQWSKLGHACMHACCATYN